MQPSQFNAGIVIFGLGGTGYQPVAVGDPPTTPELAATRIGILVIVASELSGRLPLRTAKLAVPPGIN